MWAGAVVQVVACWTSDHWVVGSNRPPVGLLHHHAWDNEVNLNEVNLNEVNLNEVNLNEV